jgi:hypothetical protein
VEQSNNVTKPADPEVVVNPINGRVAHLVERSLSIIVVIIRDGVIFCERYWVRLPARPSDIIRYLPG